MRSATRKNDTGRIGCALKVYFIVYRAGFPKVPKIL
jgi:hypothetical protein